MVESLEARVVESVDSSESREWRVGRRYQLMIVVEGNRYWMAQGGDGGGGVLVHW